MYVWSRNDQAAVRPFSELWNSVFSYQGFVIFLESHWVSKFHLLMIKAISQIICLYMYILGIRPSQIIWVYMHILGNSLLTSLLEGLMEK